MRTILLASAIAVFVSGCASTACKNIDTINDKIKNSTGLVREQLIEELKDAEKICQLEMQNKGEHQRTQSLNTEQRAKELRK